MIYGFCNEDTFASGLLVCMSVPGNIQAGCFAKFILYGV